MEIICQSCATKLSIPDDKLPKDVPVLKATCPKCQGAIEIHVPLPPAAAPSSPASAAAPTTSASATALPEEDFVEGARLAMACCDDPQLRATVKAGLEAAGYSVHAPAKGEEAVMRLRRNKYDVLILHDEFGGAQDGNIVLKTLQPMAMSLRRHMCVGLVGKTLRTLDNMAAFAKSVHFVVAEREAGKIKALVSQAVKDNDQFYRIFQDEIGDAGKA